jgi:hypothetical protein
MITNKTFKSIILRCKFKTSPNTPTKTHCKELFMSFFYQIFMNCFKSLLYFLPILIFYTIHYISMSFLIRCYQYLWYIYTITKLSKGISYTEMPSTECSKDIRDNDENLSIGITDMIDLAITNSEFFSFGLIIDFESRPWTLWATFTTTLHSYNS